ncbi:YceI family protein [Marinimicrobium alkaliphilum]|uniref:YceI family protein n=1 Tax=Marinimicrobium alkaliphilum TaxID=2202654 RepID=UPI000DB9C80D|nr:YceI family protein [Marinimicrobium alkaliphilum]
MKRQLATLLLATIGLVALPATAADYKIDTDGAHAFINFKVNHLGFSWLTGRFNDFDGDFTWDADKPEESQITVNIRTNSVDSNHSERDRHLRSDDFLHVERYPTATFVSTAVHAGEGDELTIVGDLTLHGTTRSITIDAEKVGEGEDPWGGQRVGFKGTTEFVMADFGMDYDLGPQSRTVYLELHVEGIRQ